MGLCESSTVAPESSEIDDHLNEAESEYERTTQLLLLGTGNAGKTTFYRQFQISLGEGLTQQDREMCRVFIEHQIIFYMAKVAGLALKQNSPGGMGSQLLDPVIRAATKILTVDPLNGLDTGVIDYVKTLWGDKTIHNLLCTHDTVQHLAIPESCEYFWRNIDRISTFDYHPTDEDCLQLRYPSTGVTRTLFAVRSCKFSVIDVGGQRCERPKWLHVFDDAEAVLYVISLTAYDEVLYEDGRVNAMDEQLRVFEETINKPFFEDVSIIMFMNKTDLLQTKIDEGRYLSAYFPDYRGDDDVESYCEFIFEKFMAKDHGLGRRYFQHHTCATDTRQAQTVLRDVTRMFVEDGLRNIGLR